MIVAQIMQLPYVVLALALDGGIRDGEEFVSGLSHGGDHHHRPAVLTRLDDPGHAFDGGGTLHGGAAEFHHDHQSSIPSECISSAFRTAAPAAPRMVLWLSTTNLWSSTGHARRRPTN